MSENTSCEVEISANPVIQADAPMNTRSSAKRRWTELALVLFVATALFIATSTYTAIYGVPPAIEHFGTVRVLSVLITEIAALLVLWYVLDRSGRRFADLGLKVSGRGLLAGLGLSLGFVAAGFLGYYLAYYSIQIAHFHYFGSYLSFSSYHEPHESAGWGEALLYLLYLGLNPFFEESIVRGYLMTEILELSGSTTAAVLFSVAIQISYHTYQGSLAVAWLLSGFLVLAIYYARTRKLFPVIVAHAVLDILVGLWH